LEKAKKSAGSKDVRIGGGVNTIRQYLEKKLIDELHIVVSPVFLGSGECLFQNIDLKKLGYQIVKSTNSESATHLKILKNNVAGMQI
jgi:dihydrofolate reductase